MPILRPENEEPYSDDDLDFLKHFPEAHDPKYMEVILKLMNETYRKSIHNP
jgi:hypothetical protein